MSLFKTNTTEKNTTGRQSGDKINRAIKARLNIDIRELYMSKRDYYESVRLGNFDRNNYIGY